jgi:hypothetical protein
MYCSHKNYFKFLAPYLVESSVAEQEPHHLGGAWGRNASSECSTKKGSSYTVLTFLFGMLYRTVINTGINILLLIKALFPFVLFVQYLKTLCLHFQRQCPRTRYGWHNHYYTLRPIPCYLFRLNEKKYSLRSSHNSLSFSYLGFK